jgi:hypothetical protein
VTWGGIRDQIGLELNDAGHEGGHHEEDAKGEEPRGLLVRVQVRHRHEDIELEPAEEDQTTRIEVVGRSGPANQHFTDRIADRRGEYCDEADVGDREFSVRFGSTAE